jgi:hypothetical protein
VVVWEELCLRFLFTIRAFRGIPGNHVDAPSPDRVQSPATERWAVVLLGVGFFLYRYGLSFLDPRRTDWLLGRTDAAASHLGWAFFRQTPWTWPPGSIPGYDWPAGTSIALTDSIPLLALPLKLVAGILPAEFQYLGAWLLACHVLQALFAWKLASALSSDSRVRMAGAVLGLCVPAWLHRIGHLALAGHWLLLAAWYLYLREPHLHGLAPRARRWTGLLATGSLVHPYLWVMAFGTGLAAWVRSWRRGRLAGWEVGALIGAATVAALILWYVCGMFVLDGAQAYRAEGLGTYSLNLNSLYNSSGTSRWMPALPLHFMGQYEGYAYLGLGLLVLLPVAALDAARRPGRIRRLLEHREAGLLCLLGVLFALGPIWTLGDRVVADGFWPAWLTGLAEPFRATGRFAWIFLYAALTVVLAWGARSRRARWILPAAAILVVVEMRPIERVDLYLADKLFEPRFDLEAAALHVPVRGQVILVPPTARNLVHPDDWREWALVALRRRAALGGGYLSRFDARARERFTEQVERSLREDLRRPNTLYVLGTRAQQALPIDTEALDGYGLVKGPSGR